MSPMAIDPHPGFVSIDVEPSGVIGVAEILRSGEITAWQVHFRPSGVSPGASAFKQTPCRQDDPVFGDDLDGPPPQGSLTPSWPSIWAGTPHSVPDFREVWPYVEAFIGDRVVAAYGMSYDINALAKLLVAAALPVPKLSFICGLQLARKLRPAAVFNDLQTVALGLDLFSETEMEFRRVVGRSWARNKWLLHNAADDAAANARIFSRAAGSDFDLDQLISANELKVRPLASAKCLR